MANQIKFNVDFDVKKQSLSDLKKSLEDIQKITTSQFSQMDRNLSSSQARKELAEIKAMATQVETALKNAFNVNLGSLNISKLGQELKNLDLDRIYTQFSRLGSVGNTAFRNLTTQLVSSNVQLKETYSLLDSMAKTMSNTIKWNIASGIMNKFTGSVREAYGYVKNLDASLNSIRVVTGDSADEMARFAETANNAAQKLGAGTNDYTKAALIYYQQGLDDMAVQARTETTLKVANITGQNAEAVSENLTAV